MSRKTIVLFACIFMLLCLPASSSAGDDLARVYVPNPDEIIIYNADLAQLTQRFIIQGNESFRVELPKALLPNTLRVKVDGADVPMFRISASATAGSSYSSSANLYNYNPSTSGYDTNVEGYWLEWENTGLDGAEVQLTYLAHGISWEARYSCDIMDNGKVNFHYTAAIDNRLMHIEDCRIRLLSGIVAGINQQDWNNMTMTQRGGMLYNTMSEGQYGGGDSQVTLNVHEIYDIDMRGLENNKMTCIMLFDGELEYTKHLVWDARQDRDVAGKVQVIYKVQNESSLPFAAGTVQMYEDDIFIGMDPMELTPIGSPGHITMGESMNFRVFRYQKDERITERPAGVPNWVDNKHTVTLEIRYFGEEPATLEILDTYRSYSGSIFRADGQKIIEETRYDNVLNFEVDIKKGDKKIVEYVYYTD